MLGEEGEHVVEERDAGANVGLALAVEVQADGYPGFFGVPFEAAFARFHGKIKTERLAKKKAQSQVAIVPV